MHGDVMFSCGIVICICSITVAIVETLKRNDVREMPEFFLPFSLMFQIATSLMLGLIMSMLGAALILGGK